MVSKSLQQCQLVIKNCLDMSGSSKVPTNSWAQVTKFVAELLPAEIDDRSVTLLAACVPLKFMLMLHVFESCCRPGKEAPFSNMMKNFGNVGGMISGLFGKK